MSRKFIHHTLDEIEKLLQSQDQAEVDRGVELTLEKATSVSETAVAEEMAFQNLIIAAIEFQQSLRLIPEKFITADEKNIEGALFQVELARQKAKRIIASAKQVSELCVDEELELN